jgi:hypothetical protein
LQIIEVALGFEVAMPRKGELSVRDLRSVYGADLRDKSDVDVLVLDVADGVPIAARVELSQSRWGWSYRTVLVCPTCRDCKITLLARAGKLQCKACHRELTRRQRERTGADFLRRSGREEDRLLRLLRPAVEPSATKITEARRLVQDIVTADRARLEELQRQFSGLKSALEARL